MSAVSDGRLSFVFSEYPIQGIVFGSFRFYLCLLNK